MAGVQINGGDHLLAVVNFPFIDRLFVDRIRSRFPVAWISARFSLLTFHARSLRAFVFPCGCFMPVLSSQANGLTEQYRVHVEIMKRLLNSLKHGLQFKFCYCFLVSFSMSYRSRSGFVNKFKTINNDTFGRVKSLLLGVCKKAVSFYINFQRNLCSVSRTVPVKKNKTIRRENDWNFHVQETFHR